MTLKDFFKSITLADAIGTLFLAVFYGIILPSTLHFNKQYYKWQKRERENIFLKNRRPKLSLLCLFCAMILIILRPVGILRYMPIVKDYTGKIHSSFYPILYVAITNAFIFCIIIRHWLISYDFNYYISMSKKKWRSLINETINDEFWYTQHRRTLGSSKFLIKISFIGWVILQIAFTLIALLLPSDSYINDFLYLCVFVFAIFVMVYNAMMIRKMRDTLWIRVECMYISRLAALFVFGYFVMIIIDLVTGVNDTESVYTDIFNICEDVLLPLFAFVYTLVMTKWVQSAKEMFEIMQTSLKNNEKILFKSSKPRESASSMKLGPFPLFSRGAVGGGADNNNNNNNSNYKRESLKGKLQRIGKRGSNINQDDLDMDTIKEQQEDRRSRRASSLANFLLARPLAELLSSKQNSEDDNGVGGGGDNFLNTPNSNGKDDKNDSGLNETMIGMKSIIETDIDFELFIDHLIKELAVENLLFLVEACQFRQQLNWQLFHSEGSVAHAQTPKIFYNSNNNSKHSISDNLNHRGLNKHMHHPIQHYSHSPHPRSAKNSEANGGMAFIYENGTPGTNNSATQSTGFQEFNNYTLAHNNNNNNTNNNDNNNNNNINNSNNHNNNNNNNNHHYNHSNHFNYNMKQIGNGNGNGNIMNHNYHHKHNNSYRLPMSKKAPSNDPTIEHSLRLPTMTEKTRYEIDGASILLPTGMTEEMDGYHIHHNTHSSLHHHERMKQRGHRKHVSLPVVPEPGPPYFKRNPTHSSNHSFVAHVINEHSVPYDNDFDTGLSPSYDNGLNGISMMNISKSNNNNKTITGAHGHGGHGGHGGAASHSMIHSTVHMHYSGHGGSRVGGHEAPPAAPSSGNRFNNFGHGLASSFRQTSMNLMKSKSNKIEEIVGGGASVASTDERMIASMIKRDVANYNDPNYSDNNHDHDEDDNYDNGNTSNNENSDIHSDLHKMYKVHPLTLHKSGDSSFEFKNVSGDHNSDLLHFMSGTSLKPDRFSGTNNTDFDSINNSSNAMTSGSNVIKLEGSDTIPLAKPKSIIIIDEAVAADTDHDHDQDDQSGNCNQNSKSIGNDNENGDGNGDGNGNDTGNDIGNTSDNPNAIMTSPPPKSTAVVAGNLSVEPEAPLTPVNSSTGHPGSHSPIAMGHGFSTDSNSRPFGTSSVDIMTAAFSGKSLGKTSTVSSGSNNANTNTNTNTGIINTSTSLNANRDSNTIVTVSPKTHNSKPSENESENGNSSKPIEIDIILDIAQKEAKARNNNNNDNRENDDHEENSHTGGTQGSRTDGKRSLRRNSETKTQTIATNDHIDTHTRNDTTHIRTNITTNNQQHTNLQMHLSNNDSGAAPIRMPSQNVSANDDDDGDGDDNSIHEKPPKMKTPSLNNHDNQFSMHSAHSIVSFAEKDLRDREDTVAIELKGFHSPGGGGNDMHNTNDPMSKLNNYENSQMAQLRVRLAKLKAKRQDNMKPTKLLDIKFPPNVPKSPLLFMPLTELKILYLYDKYIDDDNAKLCINISYRVRTKIQNKVDYIKEKLETTGVTSALEETVFHSSYSRSPVLSSPTMHGVDFGSHGHGYSHGSGSSGNMHADKNMNAAVAMEATRTVISKQLSHTHHGIYHTSIFLKNRSKSRGTDKDKDKEKHKEKEKDKEASDDKKNSNHANHGNHGKYGQHVASRVGTKATSPSMVNGSGGGSGSGSFEPKFSEIELIQIFDAAGEEIYKLLKDSFTRFKQTHEYQRLLNKDLRRSSGIVHKAQQSKEAPISKDQGRRSSAKR